MNYFRFRCIFFIIFIIFSGCNSRNNAENETFVIKVGLLEGPSKISMIRMMEKNKGFNDSIYIEYIIKNSPDLIISEMVRGSLDFSVLPTTTSALLYNRGVNYQLLGIPFWGTLSVVGKDTGIYEFSDLKGKTVNVMGRGMTPDIVFRFILAKEEMIPGEDITLNYTFPSPSELGNAMKAGLVDLGVVSEPYTSIILDSNDNMERIFDLNREWNRLTEGEIPLAQTAFLVKREFGQVYPKLVQKIQDSYIESIDYFLSDTLNSVQLLKAEYNLSDQETAKSCFYNLNMDYKKGFERREPIKKYLKIILSFNEELIGGRIPDENYFYTQ